MEKTVLRGDTQNTTSRKYKPKKNNYEEYPVKRKYLRSDRRISSLKIACKENAVERKCLLTTYEGKIYYSFYLCLETTNRRV